MPPEQNEVVMMMTLLLPGAVVVYYGDEIGMSGVKKVGVTCVEQLVSSAGAECMLRMQRILQVQFPGMLT